MTKLIVRLVLVATLSSLAVASVTAPSFAGSRGATTQPLHH